MAEGNCPNLLLILGDQLDRESVLLQSGDPKRDQVLMIEAREESTKVWSHKARSAMFLAAMRHHAEWLREQGWNVEYCDIRQAHADSFTSALKHYLNHFKPEQLSMLEAGEYAVGKAIEKACTQAQVSLEVLLDNHFLCSLEEFRTWRSKRKTLVMEHFYRHQRQHLDILMDGDKPLGGAWNFDRENRQSFSKQGPGMLPGMARFSPDPISEQVFADIERLFADNPGNLQHFVWPVTREQALQLLQDFIESRLTAFGPYQDAMWQGEHLLYHSGLSAALNLKLLNPREVIDAAIDELKHKRAPLASVEGFVRQILGWREFVRGVYWTEMPQLLEGNSLHAEQDLPSFYWTAETDMNCLAQVIGQTLEHGYAHHIQRLMVTGLFALLLGVKPQQVHAWYLAVYIDAVEWVEAPNTLGMSQYADGGVLGSKPYVASGRYIQRMSNYCEQCSYRPDQSTGDDACPFTILYWEFLIAHRQRFAKHPRAALQWRSLTRLDNQQQKEIRAAAKALRERLAAT